MPDTQQSTENTLRITERRVRARALVTPPIYVNLDNVNGGLVFNLSEDGLALSAAKILAGNNFSNMQIHLPDPKGWIEANGQIAWKSESRKTAGLRFVGLPEEARERIRSWLAAGISPGEPQPERGILPNLEQHPSGDVAAMTPMAPLPEPVNSSAAGGKCMLEAMLAEDLSASLDKTARVIAEPPPESRRVPPENRDYGDSSSQVRERRTYPRWPIRALSYIELGPDNGGMLLNISESGFAVTAAMTLAEDDVPTIRIQLTGSGDSIEVRGQIAWRGKSRRVAGVRFVDLTEEARRKIASRVSLESSPGEIPGQRVKVPDSDAVHAGMPEIPQLGTLTLGAATSSSTVHEQLPASVSSQASVSTFRSAKVPVARAASNASPRKLSNRSELKLKLNPVFRPVASGAGAKGLRRPAAVVILAVVTAAALGWVATPRDVRNQVIAFIAQKTEGTSKAPKEAKPPAADRAANLPVPRLEKKGSQTPGIEPIPAGGQANGSSAQVERGRPQIRGDERPPVRPTVNGAVRREGGPAAKSQSAKPSRRAAVTVTNPPVRATQHQAVESSPVQLTENAATSSTKPPLSLPSDKASIDVKVKETPPPPVKQPDAPVSPTWSVVVSSDPYPSIRVPAELSSQKVPQGRSLQIGRAIARVEPAYPDDAKREGIEGTVKLHVVVGRDGAVESVEPVSGPSLLAKAAMSAVREWRYAQTLLGGQPVETEQDIVVRFRLLNSSISRN
jgi:TonB family protein